MMTPQEVANCTFAKAAFGGYHMTSVDEFLDKLTEDYSALYKENAALKAKLKVMVDKMAEYREVEDAMRSTLLTAQKMASSMVAEAEQKRNAMIAGAATAAQNKKNELAKEVEAEERRLIEIRQRVDRELESERRRLAMGQVKLREFIREVSIVCNEELALLERLPELPVEEIPVQVPVQPPVPAQQPQEAAPAPAAVSTDTKVLGTETASVPVPAPPAAAETESTESPSAPASVAAFAPAAPEKPHPPQGDPFAEDSAAGPPEDMEATRVLNLEDLQFGRNYVKE